MNNLSWGFRFPTTKAAATTTTLQQVAVLSLSMYLPHACWPKHVNCTTMTLMSILLWAHLIVFSKGHVNEQFWPALVYEKGTQANIPCMIKGEANAYFWKKGVTYQTSEHVAANVHGAADKFANATHGKLTVSDDGTLIINNISFEDDDTYFCRVISEQIEHYTSVTVYSQISLQSFSLSIEQCPSVPGCKLYLKPGSRHKLTCTASFVSSLVDLRWGDGHDSSTTLTSLRTIKENTDGSLNISVSIEIDFDKPSVLLCEVNSPNMRGEVVTVEMESIQETEDGSKTVNVVFIVIMAVLIITNVATGICFIVKLKQSKGKRHKEISGKNYEAVPSKINTQQESELESKNEEITQLEAELESKNGEITQLEAELESKNGQLKDQQEESQSKDEEITRLERVNDTNNKAIKEKNKEIAGYKETIKEKDSEIEKFKKKVEEKEIIINGRNKQLGII